MANPVGGAQLRELGLRLKAAGDGAARRQLLAGIRAGAQPLVSDVRAAARAKLPKSGGLNTFVADSPITVRTRLAGRIVGVQIVNTRKGVRKGGTSDFGSDRGVVRHPVFGRKGKWAETQVDAGWFTDTLEKSAPTVTPFVVAAMKTISEEVCRKI
jgi:hypothetical protein